MLHIKLKGNRCKQYVDLMYISDLFWLGKKVRHFNHADKYNFIQLTFPIGCFLCFFFCWLCFRFILMIPVCLYYAVLYFPCSLAITFWERLIAWLSSVWYILVFCHFSICHLGSGVVLICIDSWSLPTFKDLIGFHYDLGYDPQTRRRSWRSGIYILWYTFSPHDKDSGEISSVQEPSCFLVYVAAFHMCHGLVCDVWLWHFPDILTYFFVHFHLFIAQSELMGEHLHQNAVHQFTTWRCIWEWYNDC